MAGNTLGKKDRDELVLSCYTPPPVEGTDGPAKQAGGLQGSSSVSLQKKHGETEEGLRIENTPRAASTRHVFYMKHFFSGCLLVIKREDVKYRRQLRFVAALIEPAVTDTPCGFLPRSVRVRLQGHLSGLCSASGDLHKCQIPRGAAFQLDPHPLPQTFIMQRSHQNLRSCRRMLSEHVTASNRICIYICSFQMT